MYASISSRIPAGRLSHHSVLAALFMPTEIPRPVVLEAPERSLASLYVDVRPVLPTTAVAQRSAR
ncbi:hypothetical protein GCM10009639_09250 [Kitasatospora putterlickiae]|uniref:Uncharacterized protein n=1 Tax=Kitasatospora putterlickiae TaxID=221725 RepID=A0ABN1XQ82_9ACTN